MSTRGNTGRKQVLSTNQHLAMKLLEKAGEMSTYQIMQEVGTATMDSTRKMMRELRNRGLVYVCHIGSDKMATWRIGNMKSVNQTDKHYEVKPVQMYRSEINRVKKDGRISMLVIDGVKIWSKESGVLV